MKNWFLCFVLIIFCSGCTSIQTYSGIGQPNPSQNVVNVYLEAATYSTEQELEKYKRAVKIAEEVLNSSLFQTRVLAGPKQQQFINPNNQESETKDCNSGSRATYTYNVVNGECMSNRQIFGLIESSSWGISARINYRWWAIWCGRPFVNEVGHREGDTIVTQQCQFNRMSEEQLASHLIHEYLHVIGFDHPYDKSANRKFTIPYFVGNTANEILNN